MIRPTRSAPADLSIHRPGKDEIEKEKRRFVRTGGCKSKCGTWRALSDDYKWALCHYYALPMRRGEIYECPLNWNSFAMVNSWWWFVMRHGSKFIWWSSAAAAAAGIYSVLFVSLKVHVGGLKKKRPQQQPDLSIVMLIFFTPKGWPQYIWME